MIWLPGMVAAGIVVWFSGLVAAEFVGQNSVVILVWPLYVVCLVSQLYYGYYAILCYRHIEFYMLVFLD